MSDTPRTTKRIVATLSMLVVLVALFTAAFIWQLSRALGGNTLSWAYVIEWPFLIGYACFFAYRDLTGTKPKKRPSKRRSLTATQEEEAAMASYNEYLAQLQREDQP